MRVGIGWMLLILGCGVIRAQGGYVIHVSYTDHASGQTPAPLVMFLDQRMVKIDTTALTGYNSALIYSRDAGTIHQIRYNDRTYLEINEDKMTALQNGVKGVSDFLQDQFGSMSTEKNAENTGDTARDFQVKYTKKRKTIGSFECEQAVVYENGVMAQEIWFVPWEKAGIRKSDLIGLIKLAEFYERLWSLPGASSMSQSLLRVPVDGLLGLTGYPVLIRILHDQHLRLTIQLGSPRKVPLRPSVFSVPEDYSRVWM